MAVRTRRVGAIGITLAVALGAAACGGSSAGSSGGGNASGSSTSAGSSGDAAVLQDPLSQQHQRAAGVTVDTTKFKKQGPWTVATIVQGPTNGWGTLFDATMRAEMKSNGNFKDPIYTAWNFKSENQINAVDQAIAQHVDAIMLSALSRKDLAPAVDRAAAAGIPVVTCMAGTDSDNYTAEVSRDIPRQGYDSMKALAESLHGKGKIVMLNGIQGVDAEVFWNSGAKAALKNYPGIKVVSEQFADWSAQKAAQVMDTVLTQQPQIDGVWVGGLEMGPAVIDSIKQDGRDMPFMAGTDPTNGFLRMAQDNKVKFFVAPFPPGAAKFCVDTVADVLSGKPVKKFTDVVDLVQGAAPYGNDQASKWYVAELNDDFIGPKILSTQEYEAAGFGRKK
ncbi:MAG: hypothetical protein JWO67_3304 [Streptosporangiaceae bacterium]|nr:hypothetical protein [Streptosporangiaceae bacterium]